MKNKVKKIWPSKRRLIQLYAALLYNAHLKGFIKGNIYTGKTKIACVPGLNCYSCPGAVGACPLGALQNALAYAGKSAGFYILGILMLYGVIFGRTICGYLCPLGLIQELLNKIPTPKIPKSKFTRVLSNFKYVILAVFVLGITLWYGILQDTTVPAFCKYICPAGTSEGAMFLLANQVNANDFGMLGIIFTRKFIIMLMIGLLCIFCYRAFCRFICPLGAIYGLFNRFNIIGVKVDASKCNGCGACVKTCKMDVKHIGDRECINCGKCMDVCANHAISIKAGSIVLKSNETCTNETDKKRKRFERVTWFIALAVLVFALVWFNFLDPAVQEKDNNGSFEVNNAVLTYGHEVGDQLPDFEIKCIDGSTFSINQAVGKPVFINLWATYCGPCVKELPIFNELYNNHKDDLELIAVHSSLIDDDPIEYLKKYNYSIPFAIDTEDDIVWDAVGGTSTIPQTIVLNREGVVIYNKRGSIDMALLEALYEEASK